MKGIIRKTGEEITIVSYHSTADRCEILDYVSYIDSKGVEHPRESMNLYWDIEVINEQKELAELQAKNIAKVVENSCTVAGNNLSKREMVALNIYTSIISGIYAHGKTGYWKNEEITERTEEYTNEFMKTFIEKEQL